MKNLKMFAIGLVAFAAMTMGVHATTSPYANEDKTCVNSDSCVAIINDTYNYTDFGKALADAQTGDTIKLLKNLTNVGTLSVGIVSTPLDKNITVDLNKFDLVMGYNELFIGEGGTLTIVGTSKNEVVSSTSLGGAFTVSEGGSLIVKGAITFGSSDTNRLVKVDGGKVTISDGATLAVKASSGKVIEFTANGGEVGLNAKVGTSAAAFAETLIDATAITEDSNAKVTFEGGNYYINKTVATVNDGLNITVNAGAFNDKTSSNDMFTVNGGVLNIENGTLTSDKGVIVRVAGGAVSITNGTLKSNSNTTVLTKGNNEGTLTIKGGKIVAEGSYSPLYFEHTKLTYSIGENVVVEGAKNIPAIYIKDQALTGIKKGGQDDPFKGMVTGGKYLYLVVGQTQDGKFTSDEVTKYIVGEGLTITDEGNYKVVNPKPQDTQEPTVGDGDANDQKPAEDVPNVPKTSDNILVYASLGLISAVSVGFTAKRKENN